MASNRSRVRRSTRGFHRGYLIGSTTSPSPAELLDDLDRFPEHFLGCIIQRVPENPEFLEFWEVPDNTRDRGKLVVIHVQGRKVLQLLE